MCYFVGDRPREIVQKDVDPGKGSYDIFQEDSVQGTSGVTTRKRPENKDSDSNEDPDLNSAEIKEAQREAREMLGIKDKPTVQKKGKANVTTSRTVTRKSTTRKGTGK